MTHSCQKNGESPALNLVLTKSALFWISVHINLWLEYLVHILGWPCSEQKGEQGAQEGGRSSWANRSRFHHRCWRCVQSHGGLRRCGAVHFGRATSKLYDCTVVIHWEIESTAFILGHSYMLRLFFFFDHPSLVWITIRSECLFTSSSLLVFLRLSLTL